MRKTKSIFIVFLLCLFGCVRHAPELGLVDKIVCFGNSLTQGVGASAGKDYPSILAKELNIPVINAGRSGDTTAEALARIEKDVLRHQARLVIVEFGANDFLKQIPKKETFANLEKIVSLLKQRGSAVVLLQVRTGFFVDEYLEGFRKIAREKNVLLITDILREILGNPELMSDNLHPNDAGYQVLAQRILKEIKPILERQKKSSLP